MDNSLKDLLQILGISMGIMLLSMATRDIDFMFRLLLNIPGLLLLIASLDSRYRRKQ